MAASLLRFSFVSSSTHRRCRLGLPNQRHGRVSRRPSPWRDEHRVAAVRGVIHARRGLLGLGDVAAAGAGADELCVHSPGNSTGDRVVL